MNYEENYCTALTLMLYLTLFSCKSNTYEKGKFEVNELDFYTNDKTLDRKVKLIFYEDAPNVGISLFFKEFYKLFPTS